MPDDQLDRPGPGELHGVIQEIEQNLTQACLVANEVREVGRECRMNYTTASSCSPVGKTWAVSERLGLRLWRPPRGATRTAARSTTILDTTGAEASASSGSTGHSRKMLSAALQMDRTE
jgi:hypothetical protein